MWRKKHVLLSFTNLSSIASKYRAHLEYFGQDRQVSITREIAKAFTTVSTGSGTGKEVFQHYTEKPPKGEIVIVELLHRKEIGTSFIFINKCFFCQRNDGRRRTIYIFEEISQKMRWTLKPKPKPEIVNNLAKALGVGKPEIHSWLSGESNSCGGEEILSSQPGPFAQPIPDEGYGSRHPG